MADSRRVLRYHREAQGKTETIPKVLLENADDLSTYYTPGASYVSSEIRRDRALVYDYTTKSNTIAIVSDGTRILGLGNIGPEAGLPVMEGKAVLFKRLGGVDAVPLCVGTTDEDSIVRLVKSIAPTFGGINIEDIESPKSFRIVQRLEKELDIPVFHDDRQGTGVVALAALINSLKLAGKGKGSRIVINGAGSAGFGITMQLISSGFRNVIVADRGGAIYAGRKENMNYFKTEIAASTNPGRVSGALEDILKGADVFIGVSSAGAFKKEYVSLMAGKPVVFALANPDPEIEYDDAVDSGAYVVATGRSDRPNQVNNLLAFPGIMRGLLDSRARSVTYPMLHSAAVAIADSVGRRLSRSRVIPSPLERGFALNSVPKISARVAEAAVRGGCAGHRISYEAAKARAVRLIGRYRMMERSTRRYLVGPKASK